MNAARNPCEVVGDAGGAHDLLVGRAQPVEVCAGYPRDLTRRSPMPRLITPVLESGMRLNTLREDADAPTPDLIGLLAARR